jgi:hypothetical protein
MKVSELIKKLQELNSEHFATMKEVTPMGHVPDEPDIYIDCVIDEENYGCITKDIDVILDLTTGIHIIEK